MSYTSRVPSLMKFWAFSFVLYLKESFRPLIYVLKKFFPDAPSFSLPSPLKNIRILFVAYARLNFFSYRLPITSLRVTQSVPFPHKYYTIENPGPSNLFPCKTHTISMTFQTQCEEGHNSLQIFIFTRSCFLFCSIDPLSLHCYLPFVPEVFEFHLHTLRSRSLIGRLSRPRFVHFSGREIQGGRLSP